MPDNRPIGIFDSGIGGLTIARSVSALMPDEQILFLATRHTCRMVISPPRPLKAM